MSKTKTAAAKAAEKDTANQERTAVEMAPVPCTVLAKDGASSAWITTPKGINICCKAGKRLSLPNYHAQALAAAGLVTIG